MQKICIKCGHVNTAATGAVLEPCPGCGAIYSRVEAAALLAEKGAEPVRRVVLAPPSLSTSPTAGAPRTTPFIPAAQESSSFVERMREASLYPTFRSLVRLFYLLWLVLAVVCLCSGAATFVFGEGTRRILGPLFGLFFALFFYFVAKVSTEMSLMLADMSDATVRMAERQEATR